MSSGMHSRCPRRGTGLAGGSSGYPARDRSAAPLSANLLPEYLYGLA